MTPPRRRSRSTELADLAIEKSVDPGTAQPGDIVTYTVTMTNNGPNDATDMEAVDPERLTAEILDVTVSQGDLRPGHPRMGGGFSIRRLDGDAHRTGPGHRGRPDRRTRSRSPSPP